MIKKWNLYWIKMCCALLLGAGFFMPAASWAQDQITDKLPSTAQDEVRSHKRVDWWKGLSTEEKEKLRDRFRRWKEMDPKRKDVILKRFDEFRNLPLDRKQQIKKNWEKFRDLPPEKRDFIKKQYHDRWRHLSDDEKQDLRKRHHRLDELSPGERERLQKKRQEWDRLSDDQKDQARDHFRQRDDKKTLHDTLNRDRKVHDRSRDQKLNTPPQRPHEGLKQDRPRSHDSYRPRPAQRPGSSHPRRRD